MEYVNIKSLATSYSTPAKTREELLSKYDEITSPDHVIATDSLELLRGQDLVQAANDHGQAIVPLRRASYIKAPRSFPNRVLLELTSKCNSDCTMCPRTVLTRKEQHMDTQLAKEVISQLATVGISGLWLYNIGESLLHPDFIDILAFCRTFDTLGPIWLSTNGQILDAEMRERLLYQPVDILNYSLNAMSEEQYRKISPQTDFYRVQRNFRDLIKEKRRLNQLKPIIRAQMIEIPYVMHEVELFKKEFGNKADTVAFNKLEVFSQNVDASSPEHRIVNKGIPRCNRLEREDFMIFSDGSVTCCDTDFNCTFSLGNVNDQAIKQIYEGEVYQGLIQKYHDGTLHEMELCSRCRDFGL